MKITNHSKIKFANYSREKNIYVSDEMKKISIRLSDQLDSLGKYLQEKGVQFAYDEFPVDRDAFNKAAREIFYGLR